MSEELTENEEVETQESTEQVSLADKIDQVAESRSNTEDVEDSPESEEYTPDFSYTIKDEKREFDESLRSFLTSREQEEKLRDLYTRADGLETYKEKFNKRDNEFNELSGQSSALLNGYQKIKELRDSNDMRGLQRALGLKKEQILDYASVLLDEEELPEEQQQMINQNREMSEKLQLLENELNQFKTSSADRRVQDDMRELEGLLNSDKYKPLADEMAANGFNMFDEVHKAGHHEYLVTNKEPAIVDVVDQVAQRFGAVFNTNNNNEQQEETEVTIQDIQKKTLPRVKGTSKRAVEQKVRSIADLRKLSNGIMHGG